MPQLRKDPISSRWIIIAEERSQRPVPVVPPNDPQTGDFCPFCPGNETTTPREVFRVAAPADSTAPWAVRVVPNKYPALRVEGNLDREGEGLYDLMSGVGAHEVIVETSEHDASLADLPLAQVSRVLATYRARVLDLRRDIRLEYVLVFKNHRAVAGATLAHPHSQLVATPVVPLSIVRELEAAKEHFALKQRCLFCDILRQELRDGRRLVYESDAVVGIAPFASRFPFEVWVIPKRHRAHFEAIDDAELDEVAAALRDVLGRLHHELSDPPFNMLLHTAPPRAGELAHYHWHLEILPALRYQVGGFELGSGFYINPTPPEVAAEYLRRVDLTERSARGGP